jgi:SAM-dependent methyltransferase
MTNHSPCNKTAFDVYAADYDVALAHGLSVSGEDKSYFARGRIEWLRGCLQPIQESFQTVMDYGCGTGSASDFFFDVLGVDRLIGTDISPKALEIARQKHSSERTQFLLFDQYQPSGQIDLAFCNGVFHHIPPNERAAAVDYIYRALRPGGLFAFWENNPWNPGTRYVMSRIPFDRDAITLTPSEARRVLRASGFEILRTDFLFIFPRMLNWFRGIEPFLSRLPFGTQYQVLCRRPSSL